MDSPSGKVYQAGTFSGNPLAMTAGYYALKEIDDNKKFYKRLNEKCGEFYESLRKILSDLNLPYKISFSGSMFTLFFTDKDVVDYETSKTSDAEKFGLFFKEMLKRGILLPPSQYEAWFISNAHSEKDLKKALKAVRESLKAIE
jgi:glutamate-1-semialdehyde 2,1-aminomutase